MCGEPPRGVALAAPVDWEYGVIPERPFRVLACGGCASEWLDPRPTETEIVRFYPSDYHAYNDDHGFVASALVWLRGRLRSRYYRGLLGGSTGRIFDVGAGDCRHFDEVGRGANFTFAGVEINPAMASEARRRGYDVETGTLEELDLGRHEGRYDLVSMNHVLEHVVDPLEVVRRARRLLRPGGWLVGELPTISSWEHAIFGPTWAGYHYPRHLQMFSTSGLEALFAKVGLEAVRCRATPHAQIALSLQNVLVARGARPNLRFGRARWFGVLLAAALPIEVAAAAFRRSGVIDFEARRP